MLGRESLCRTSITLPRKLHHGAKRSIGRRYATKLTQKHKGKFLVIDIETGEYEMNADDLVATKRLLAKRPNAVVYGLQIGFPTAYRIGGHLFGTSAMITGKITTNREAIIELEVIGLNQRREKVEAVIDTGFNGYLTLPNNLINYLRLQRAGSRHVTLGDGSVVVLDVYLAMVLWHGQQREVLALQAEGGSSIGMSLLYGNRVMLEVISDGDVTIASLL